MLLTVTFGTGINTIPVQAISKPEYNSREIFEEVDMDNIHCKYSIVVNTLTPYVKPGDTIKIQLYVSGYGTPVKNKLSIFWSSPEVINKSDPGSYTYSIDAGGAGASYVKTLKLNKDGMYANLSTSFFTDNPLAKIEANSGLPVVLGECIWDEYPPFQLLLNTSKKAPSGDYNVSFIFSYTDLQNNIFQDDKVAQFHVSSYWERTQLSWAIAGGIIALLSLLVTCWFLFYDHWAIILSFFRK
jgi:hypothetical protein